jgi:hypothetical protein
MTDLAMKTKPLIFAIVSSFLFTAPAWAKHWHEDGDHWKEHSKKHEARDDDDREFDHGAERCYFELRDLRVMSEYYAPRYRSLPPGLAKKLYRTGHLPPGWERKMEPLPVVVERQLVPLPGGYQRGVIDGYAVVYSPRTRVIIDVVALFGPR